MEDKQWKFRDRRYCRRRPQTQNDQLILRYLAENESLSLADLRDVKKEVHLFPDAESVRTVLERLWRCGKIRRAWSCGQLRYSLCEGTCLALLRPVEDDIDLALRGTPLTRSEIEAMERRLNAQPGNVDLRCVLLDTYAMHLPSDRRDRKGERRYRSHLLHLIKTDPGHRRLGGQAYVYNAQHGDDRAGAAAITRLWRTQLQAHPDDPDVLANALHYFRNSDTPDFESVFEEEATAPESSDRFRELGRRHERAAFGADGEVKKEKATLALAAFEKAWEIGTKDSQSDAAQIAELAIALGQWEKARRFAQIALTTPDRIFKKGDERARYEANLVMGRLALRDGDRAAAGDYLLAAGDIDGTKTFCFGNPHTLLAKQMLEVGEREVVLRYFARCSRSWPSEFSDLAQWTQAVERREMPNFGRHLR